jgi:hypothetical protein
VVSFIRKERKHLLIDGYPTVRCFYHPAFEGVKSIAVYWPDQAN